MPHCAYPTGCVPFASFFRPAGGPHENFLLYSRHNEIGSPEPGHKVSRLDHTAPKAALANFPVHGTCCGKARTGKPVQLPFADLTGHRSPVPIPELGEDYPALRPVCSTKMLD